MASLWSNKSNTLKVLYKNILPFNFTNSPSLETQRVRCRYITVWSDGANCEVQVI
jgi:hypothetical protein